MKNHNLLLSFLPSLFLANPANAAIIFGTHTNYAPGDMFAGLDLTGDLRAASFGNGTNYTVNGIQFSGTSDTNEISFGTNIAGITGAANSGDSDLNDVLSSGIHSTPFINITSIVGQAYGIQLLFYGSQVSSGTDRTMDITVDGVLFADDLRVVNGQHYIYNFSTIAGSDGIININFTNGADGDDCNPFVQGVVVTVPEPSSTALLGLGGLALLLRRRR